MTPALERRYRRLLRAYPTTWRAERAAEMLGTLADGASPGQRFPTPREVAGLLAGGLRARAWEAGGRSTTGTIMDGLYLGAVLMYLLTATTMLTWFAGVWDTSDPRFIVLRAIEVALTPIGIVALLRGWLLPVVVVVAAHRLAPALITGGATLDDGIANAAAFWLDQAYPAVILAGLALATRLRWTTWRPRRLPALWLAAPGVLLAMMLAQVPIRASGIDMLIQLHGRLALALGVATLIATLLVALADPRVTVGAAVWIVPLAVALPGASPGAERLALYTAMIVGLLLTATLMTRRLARL